MTTTMQIGILLIKFFKSTLNMLSKSNKPRVLLLESSRLSRGPRLGMPFGTWLQRSHMVEELPMIGIGGFLKSTPVNTSIKPLFLRKSIDLAIPTQPSTLFLRNSLPKKKLTRLKTNIIWEKLKNSRPLKNLRSLVSTLTHKFHLKLRIQTVWWTPFPPSKLRVFWLEMEVLRKRWKSW